MQKRRTEKKSIFGYVRPTLMMSAFFMCVAIVLLREHFVFSHTKDALMSFRGDTLSGNSSTYNGTFPTNKTLESICRIVVLIAQICFSILLKVATVIFLVGAIISVPKLLGLVASSIKKVIKTLALIVKEVALRVENLFFKPSESEILLTTYNLN